MLGKISRILKIRVFFFFFFLATVMEDDEKSHDSRINRERSNRATRRAKSFNRVVEQQHLDYKLLTINCPCSRYKIKDNSMSGFRFSYRTYRFNAKWDSLSRSANLRGGGGTGLYYRINLPWYTCLCVYTLYGEGERDVRRVTFLVVR